MARRLLFLKRRRLFMARSFLFLKRAALFMARRLLFLKRNRLSMAETDQSTASLRLAATRPDGESLRTVWRRRFSWTSPSDWFERAHVRHPEIRLAFFLGGTIQRTSMIPHPRFLVLLIACVACNGCFAPRPVTFRVLDAETEKPIESVTVTAEYEDIWIGYLMKIPVAPTKGTTGADGKTLLLMHEPTGEIDFSKEGYLPYWGNGLHSEIPRWPFNTATCSLVFRASAAGLGDCAG